MVLSEVAISINYAMKAFLLLKHPLYTADEVERAYIDDNLPDYSYDGIKYYVFESQPQGIDTIPMFRFLESKGSHLYTIDQNEFNNIQNNLPNYTLENNGDPVFYVLEL